jgi:uncharacterized protein with GYD domain
VPAYIALYKLTQQGLANLKPMPEQIKQAKAAVEKAGGRTIGIWLTMGEYDFVGITEWPDDQAAAAFLLRQGSGGFLTTQTMRAFSEDEFAQIVGKLP